MSGSNMLKPGKKGHTLKTDNKRSGEAFPKPYTVKPMNQRPSDRKSGKLSIY